MDDMQTEYNKKRIEQFWSQVDKSEGENGCWHWTRNCGFAGEKGYGQYYFNGKKVTTHRFAYLLECGAIPPKMEVCHTCDTPSCCNPRHLFLGTHQQNMQDRSKKGRGGGALGKTPGLRPTTLVDYEVRPKHYASGEKNAHAKLTEADVRQIRKTYAEGNISQRKLAAQYGVHASLIGFIVRRTHWKHVADEVAVAPRVIQLPMFTEDEGKKAA